MKTEDDFDDAFELDSISFGRIPSNQNMNQSNEFPLRIGTNFFQTDSDSFTNQNQNKSLDEILNQRIANQKNSKQNGRLKYSTEQIIKINKINQSIKSIVVLENQLKSKLKSKLIKFMTQNKPHDKSQNVRKNFSQIVKKLFRNFENLLSSQRVQPIKYERISSITTQKRSYYLNDKDKKQMVRRKFIKTLIAEKDVQLLKKRGQLKNQQSLVNLKTTVKKYEQFITQCASSIDQNKMSGTINKVIKSDLQQLGQELKNQSAKNQQTMTVLNNQIGKKIAELLQVQEIVNRKKLKKQMELQTKIISTSENLLEIVRPKRLFQLMPDFNRQNFLKI